MSIRITAGDLLEVERYIKSKVSPNRYFDINAGVEIRRYEQKFVVECLHKSGTNVNKTTRIFLTLSREIVVFPGMKTSISAGELLNQLAQSLLGDIQVVKEQIMMMKPATKPTRNKSKVKGFYTKDNPVKPTTPEPIG